MVTSGIRSEISVKTHQLVGLLVILLLIIGFYPAGVDAHATLLGSTPADGSELDSGPTEIVLEFSEPVGVVDGGTVLHGSGIESIALSAETQGSTVVIPLDQSLEDGAYILQWRVISTDSHPVSGTVSFTIGDADPDAAGSVTSELPGWIDWSRTGSVALKYMGLLAAFGLLLVGARLVPGDFRPTMRIATVFAAVGLVGIVAELPFAAMAQRGDQISTFRELWVGLTGLDSGIRAAATISAVAVVLVISGSRYFQSWRVPLILMTFAILTLVLSGHTRSQRPIWVMMVSDIVHVITAVVWLGGIVLLTLGLRGRWQGEGFATGDLRFRAVSRFSTLAGWTAAAVILSGTAMALVVLDSFDALFGTGYGITLVIKIGLVLLVLLMAAANRFFLIPMHERPVESSSNWLQRVVSVELIMLVAIASISGSLVHRDPNVQADVVVLEEVTIIVYEGELALDSEHTVRVKVTADARDQVTIVATIIDENRDIVLPDANLQLNWVLPEKELGPLNQALFLDSATGAYIGTYSLPASGTWELGIQVRIDRFTDSRTTVEIVVPD